MNPRPETRHRLPMATYLVATTTGPALAFTVAARTTEGLAEAIRYRLRRDLPGDFAVLIPLRPDFTAMDHGHAEQDDRTILAKFRIRHTGYVKATP